MPTAKDLLNIAIGELGIKESPANSNNVKYNTWYYGKPVSGSSYPWCVVFVQWIFNQCNFPLPVKTASCSVLMKVAKSAGMWVTSDYRPGDVVIYDWKKDGYVDHCGIVETSGGTSVVAIEGNTAIGNDSDGGEVMRRTRTISQIVGAVRPNYDQEEDMDVTKLTKDDIRYLISQIQSVLSEDEPSETLKPELEEAIAMGITDGKNPNSLSTRIQTAVMCKRTAKYIENK